MGRGQPAGTFWEMRDAEGKWDQRKCMERRTSTFKVHQTAWQVRKKANARTQDRNIWPGQSGAVDPVKRKDSLNSDGLAS